MPPRLTIAIPTINRAQLLVRAIESALAQTSLEIEILVSDNGSTDDTPAVIARYAGRGLRTFRHDSTISAAKHGDFLREQARGEFFLGLSDDDYLEPEFAAEVLAMFDRHRDLVFVYTGCAVHYDDCQVPALVGPAVEPGTDFLLGHYSGKREVSWCATVTRLRDLKEIGPQPEDRVLGDMFFWTKLAFKGPVGCVPRVLSHYILFRSQNDNISHGTPPPVWARESRLLADEVIAGARRSGVDSDYLSRLEANCKLQVGRSTANQFIWCRLRGAGPAQTWLWLFGCFPYLPLKTRLGLSRVAAALLPIPRKVLKRLLLKAAAELAKQRRLISRYPQTVITPRDSTYSPWLADSEFARIYQAVRQHTMVEVYRLYGLWALAQQLRRLPGEFIEIGCWRGGSACVLAVAAERPVIVCDTFAGVAKASSQDNSYIGGEHADASEADVRAIANSLGVDLEILPGVFPDETGPRVADQRFAMCHVDVDTYRSAKDAGDWLWPRLLPGGAIVYDDYGCATCDGIREYIEEQRQLPDRITIHNLNGQAVVIKL